MLTIRKDVVLSEIVWYKIGGRAKILLEVHNSKDLIDAFSYTREHKIGKVVVLGLGSNLLITDVYFDGVVIHISNGDVNAISLGKDGLVSAYAGVTLDEVIQFSFAHGLVGLEWAGGLPSSIGGAIHGNVGCFGSEIRDVVHEVHVLDRSDSSLKLQVYTPQMCEFSYRNSIFKSSQNLVIVGGVFKLQKGNEEGLAKAREVYENNIAYRTKNHPIEYPSCGSIFKNITKKEDVEKIITVWPDIRDLVEGKWHGKVAMGYVTKRLGLFRKRVGDAEISQKHANYISNLGQARFEDVKILIDEIRALFYKTFGFYPELEVEIWE